MNRRITYANSLASSDFFMRDQVELQNSLGVILKAILGTTTELDGFECTPTTSPSLTVDLEGGTLFSYENVDDNNFGELPSQIPADTTNQVLKFAYTLATQQLTFVPPTTPGYSRNDLIQIAFEEVDGTSTSIPFFGGVAEVTVTTPTGTALVPVPNPATNQSKNIQRLDNVVIAVKAGTAAATGTQATPTPDVGYTGMWVITTTNGDSTINTGDINEYSGAPFITNKLKDMLTQALADIRYAQKTAVQNNSFNTATSTGSSNAYVLALTPALTAYANGQVFEFTPNFNNTGAATLNINGLGAVAIKKNSSAGGDDLVAGDINTSNVAVVVKSGSQFTLLNPAAESSGLPIGAGAPFFGGTIPTGWLACDGSAISRTTYAALFAAIGTTWGIGDGSTTFNLPPACMTFIGAGSHAGLTTRTLGQTGGDEERALTGDNNGPHTHTYSEPTTVEGVSGGGGSSWRNVTSAETTSSSGAGTPFSIMNPFAVVNYIIKYQ